MLLRMGLSHFLLFSRILLITVRCSSVWVSSQVGLQLAGSVLRLSNSQQVRCGWISTSVYRMRGEAGSDFRPKLRQPTDR
jgi:hypothetical protein